MFRKFKFLISEIGINHEGNVQKCKRMIKQSKMLGMDAAKLQIVSPEIHIQKIQNLINYLLKQICDDQIQAIFDYAKSKINYLQLVTL